MLAQAKVRKKAAEWRDDGLNTLRDVAPDPLIQKRPTGDRRAESYNDAPVCQWRISPWANHCRPLRCNASKNLSNVARQRSESDNGSGDNPWFWDSRRIAPAATRVCQKRVRAGLRACLSNCQKSRQSLPPSSLLHSFPPALFRLGIDHRQRRRLLPFFGQTPTRGRGSSMP
jgi:hypothetical protein